jgi:hypothetical protein
MQWQGLIRTVLCTLMWQWCDEAWVSWQIKQQKEHIVCDADAITAQTCPILSSDQLESMWRKVRRYIEISPHWIIWMVVMAMQVGHLTTIHTAISLFRQRYFTMYFFQRYYCWILNFLALCAFISLSVCLLILA